MTQQGDQNVIWPQDIQDDHIVAGVSDDDFTKFLDLDNDFYQFASMGQHPSGLDTPMGRLGFGSNNDNITFAGQNQMDLSMASANNGVTYRLPMQQNHSYPQFQQQFQQMQMQPHYHVPPTPVSAEMHAAKYVQQMGNNGQILFDHQQVCAFVQFLPVYMLNLDRSRSLHWSRQLKLPWMEALPCPTMA